MNDKQHPDGPVLQAFHDGELDTAATAEVAAHCEHCAVCRKELTELEQVGRWLAGAPQPAPPPTVWHRVRPGRARDWRLKPVLGLAACAAGIVLGILLGPIEFNSGQADTELAWSENLTVWDSSASASLLDVFQYEQE